MKKLSRPLMLQIKTELLNKLSTDSLEAIHFLIEVELRKRDKKEISTNYGDDD